MMYSEFIERTQYSEKYITFQMYTEQIEPCYMNAPEFVNKDMFCAYFVKMHTQTVSTIVEGLISAHTTTQLIDYIAGEMPMTDVEMIHTELLCVFLRSFQGLSKSHWRDEKIKRDRKSA